MSPLLQTFTDKSIKRNLKNIHENALTFSKQTLFKMEIFFMSVVKLGIFSRSLCPLTVRLALGNEVDS
jgi:hypothetical protein